MMSVEQSGDFDNIEKFLQTTSRKNKKTYKILKKYAEVGLQLLIENTHVRSGESALGWDYILKEKDGQTSIAYINTNMTTTGVPVVVLIQYGHGTKNGGYVKGINFINPTINQMFKDLSTKLYQELIKG